MVTKWLSDQLQRTYFWFSSVWDKFTQTGNASFPKTNTHTHTRAHAPGKRRVWGGCSVPTVRSPSPNKNSTATASVWCERLREPGMRRCSVDSRSEETRLEIFNLFLDKGKPSEKTKANSEHTCYTWSQVHIQYIIYSHVCCTYQSLPVKLAPQRQWCTWTFVRVRTFM